MRQSDSIAERRMAEVIWQVEIRSRGDLTILARTGEWRTNFHIGAISTPYGGSRRMRGTCDKVHSTCDRICTIQYNYTSMIRVLRKVSVKQSVKQIRKRILETRANQHDN